MPTSLMVVLEKPGAASERRVCLEGFNRGRIVGLDRNDWAAKPRRDRYLFFVRSGSACRFETINDVMEIHQLKPTSPTIPELFEGIDGLGVSNVVKDLFANACQYCGSLMSSTNILKYTRPLRCNMYRSFGTFRARAVLKG